MDELLLPCYQWRDDDRTPTPGLCHNSAVVNGVLYDKYICVLPRPWEEKGTSSGYSPPLTRHLVDAEFSCFGRCTAVHSKIWSQELCYNERRVFVFVSLADNSTQMINDSRSPMFTRVKLDCPAQNGYLISYSNFVCLKHCRHPSRSRVIRVVAP